MPGDDATHILDDAASIRVVLVDDDEDTLFIIGTLLTRRGFAVETVASGVECLRRLATNPPDIVVTDVQMPEMTGIELARRVRDEFPAVAVVVMSGLATEPTVDAALDTGAFTFLSKPVSAQTLESVLVQAASAI